MDLHNSGIWAEHSYYGKRFCYFTDDKTPPWHFPDRTISYQGLSACLLFMSNKTAFDWSDDVKSSMCLNLPSQQAENCWSWMHRKQTPYSCRSQVAFFPPRELKSFSALRYSCWLWMDPRAERGMGWQQQNAGEERRRQKWPQAVELSHTVTQDCQRSSLHGDSEHLAGSVCLLLLKIILYALVRKH